MVAYRRIHDPHLLDCSDGREQTRNRGSIRCLILTRYYYYFIIIIIIITIIIHELASSDEWSLRAHLSHSCHWTLRVRSRASGDLAGATATTADEPLSTTTTSSSDLTPPGPCVSTALSVTAVALDSRCDVESVYAHCIIIVGYSL